MIVKLITRMAGPEGVFPPGSVVTLDDGKAQKLIERGYAIKDGDTHGNVLHDNGRKPSTRKKS